LACAAITALFCIPYATIYMALSHPLGTPRSSTSAFPVSSLIPVVLMGSFLVFVVWKVALQRTTVGIVQYLRRADYEGALARTEQILRWFPHSGRFLSLRGVILLLAGKVTEAEQALRGGLETARIAVVWGRGLRMIRLAPEQTLMLVNLGHALLAQDRRRDAAAAYEGAAKLLPVYWGAYNGLAEACLCTSGTPTGASVLSH